MNTELWLLTLSCICFVAGFLSSLMDLREHGVRHTKFHMAVNTLGFILQTAFLGARSQTTRHCPFTTPFELLVFLAWAVMLVYFLSGSAFRISLLGFFTAPLVLALQLVALALPKAPRVINMTPLVEWHAAVSLLSYGAFALTAVAGVMYLVQDHLLKKHDLGELFRGLPPLSALGRALTRVLIIGVLLCTVGMVSAFFLRTQVSPVKLGLTVVIWIAYSALLALVLTRRLSPRQVALASTALFLIPLLSLSVLHVN